MATISYQTITRRHGAKRITRRKRFKAILKTLLNILCLYSVLGLFAVASLHALDNNIYPDCKVLSQSYDILKIKVDPEIDDGTDTGCYETAKIIYAICQDGYRVHYWGRVIDIDEAEDLVTFTGEPIPADYEK